MLQFGRVSYGECAEELHHDEVGGDGDGGDHGHHNEVGAGHGGKGQVIQLLPAGRHQGGAHGRKQGEHGVDAADLVAADSLTHQGPVHHHVHGVQEPQEAAKAEPVEDKTSRPRPLLSVREHGQKVAWRAGII